MMGLALAKKELKQNALLYLLPYLCGLFLIILNWRHQIPLTKEWQNLLAVILPITIAGAFGLQSFDLEENGQTRDFLLTRPFTAEQVIKVKYITGLVVLLPIAFLWCILFLPDSLKLPTLTDWSSFWWLTLFLLIITIYTQSFTAAIFVRGPLKIMAAIGGTFFMSIWFFYSWFEGITVFYWFELFHYPIICWIMLAIFTAGLVLFQIIVALNAAHWNIAQLPAVSFKKKLCVYLLVFLFIPVLLGTSTACRQPAIKPFSQLFKAAFTSQPWFITLEGEKQPAGHRYAFIDTTGKLALGQLNQMPQVVYSSSNSSQPLSNLNWSPNGQKILFREGEYLKVYDLNSGTVQSVTEGDIGLWSADSNRLITAKIVKSEPQISDWGSFNQTVYQLSLVNLDDGSVQSFHQLTSSGSSLAWDSLANRLLAVDISGYLVSISLNDFTVSYIPIYQSETKEPIVYSKFEYTGSGHNQFYVTVFSMDVENPNALRQKQYNIRSFLFDADSDSFTPLFKLSGVQYQDIILTHKPGQLLVRSNDLGIYQKITIPQEAGAK
ncbi:MAG TPA: ABC-2 transporter permease [Bacillota bacterium]|nr:ABC-2 transporter permease [Bacillota bacterium]